VSEGKHGEAKKAQRVIRPHEGGLARWLAPGRRWLPVTVLLATALVGGGYAVWREFGPRVVASSRFRLSPLDVSITPLPAWIHSDIKTDALRDAGLDSGASILDDDLAERIKKAFALHPWVSSVVRVTKRPPARVEVELVYRQPVCMVDLPGGVYPVDAASVVLPRDDFSVSEARRYPRLSGIATVPAGLVGTPWGDLQVAGGAELANLLANSWDELKLLYINVVDAGSGDFTYEVFVRPTAQQQSPTRIIWGHRPGHEQPGEAAAADKLTRLKQYATEHGSLAGGGDGQDLDLRYGPNISAAPRTARKP
jgi:hypothetical protein